MAENKKIRTLTFPDSTDKYEFVVKAENIEGDVGVGKATEQGGEIFNDYENNKALAENTIAMGTASRAGCYGYHIASTLVIDNLTC